MYYSETRTNNKLSIFHLLGVSVICVTLGFFGGKALSSQNSTQLVLPSVALRNTLVGAAIATTASNAIPAVAVEQYPVPYASQVAIAQPSARLAAVKEAPSLRATVAEEEIDYIEIAILALAVPVLGYGAWQFGTARAKADTQQAREKFKENLAKGNVPKVSASGLATVNGLPLASDAGWKIQCDELRARGIKGLTGEQLKEKVAAGSVTVVDVRPKDRYEQAAIPGSISVPLFQPITGWSPFKIARRVQFAIFGLAGTEYNPDFMTEFQQKTSAVTKDMVILDDSVRGTLEATTAFPDGKASHALLAVYLTNNSGPADRKVTYLEGGIGSYIAAGGDMVESS